MTPGINPAYNPAQGLYERSIPRHEPGRPFLPARIDADDAVSSGARGPGTASTITTPNTPGGASLSGLGALASLFSRRRIGRLKPR